MVSLKLTARIELFSKCQSVRIPSKLFLTSKGISSTLTYKFSGEDNKINHFIMLHMPKIKLVTYRHSRIMLVYIMSTACIKAWMWQTADNTSTA